MSRKYRKAEVLDILLQSDSENGDSDDAGDDNDDDYESESGDESTADESDSGDDSLTTTATVASGDGASSAVNSSTPAIPTPQWHPVSASDLPADQPLCTVVAKSLKTP